LASLVHIYMEHPDTHEFFTLGNLTLRGRFGEFSYAPDHIERNGWVPDPVNYPLRAEAYTGVVKNNGVPGFINDATPDGWGERLLQCVFGQELTQIDILLKSTNSDRMGNLMIGSGTAPPPGLGDGSAPKLNSLAGFVEDCDAIYAGQLNGAPTAHNLRQHFSSLGGARPKRTFRDKGKLILVKPRDRFDQYDLPSIEFACMTFAASKGDERSKYRAVH
jgi:serine/threonine-protein kinase HipA